MNTSDQIIKIVDSLITGTEDGSVSWIVRNSCFSSETSYYYQTFSNDGVTYFEMEISLEDNLSLRTYPHALWIHNPSLVNGRKQVSESDCSNIKKIQVLIFNKYVKPNLIHKKETSTLDSIFDGMFTKSAIRDKKLNEILNTEDNVPVDTKDNKQEKKPGFFKNLFK